MNRYILVFIFMLGLNLGNVNADECPDYTKRGVISPTLKGMFENIDAVLLKSINNMPPSEALDFISEYLNRIKDTLDFDEKLAQSYVKKLFEISNTKILTIRIQARAKLICSGVLGKLSDKKKSAAYGKDSFYLLKAAQKLDPSYGDARDAYITTVASMTGKNAVLRRIIQFGMDVSLKVEVKEAIRLMEGAKLQEDPKFKSYYQILKRY